MNTIILFYVIPMVIITIVACIWAYKKPGRTRIYTDNASIDTKKQIDDIHKQQTYKFWRDFDK